MASIPETSTTLLRDLAKDTQHARWGEFVARYRPMMEAFMRESFPSLEADDVIQETLIALIRVFPVYHYVPEEKGSFHNYLTGILRHKALKALGEQVRGARLLEHTKDDAIDSPSSVPPVIEEADEKAWRDSVFEIALQQYLADETVASRTKQVFTRLAVEGASPEEVARAFGIERNAVDQIKSRATARLRGFVKALEEVGDARLDT